MNNPRIGIINAGAWGTAMAKNLAEKGYAVSIWDPLSAVRTMLHRLTGITGKDFLPSTPEETGP